jgi:hypothetical protein
LRRAAGFTKAVIVNRTLPLALMIAMAASVTAAPETAPSSPTPPPAPPSAAPAPAAAGASSATTPVTLVTLAMLEAQSAPARADAGYWPFALQQTNQAFALIEGNTLQTADEFFRVSKLVSQSENQFRTDRVRYELLLAAAALGHPEAGRGLAFAWDNLLASLGRPLRTDFAGLVQKQPEFFEFAAAPACVSTVLRDPEKARVAAKSAPRNAELKTIVDADQADRRNWNKLTPEEMKATGERDTARNRRTREIIAAGDLHTAADFANAALVMQHSAGFSGFETAHELAVCSTLLGDRGTGRWLIAATYDRMLGSIGHDQRFGTQYRGMGGTTTLVRVDTAGICDAERKALGCPTLEEAKNRNLGAAAATETDKLVAEFTGPARSVHDPKFGLTLTYPEGWKVMAVNRWGDQQQTISFEATAQPEANPSLYYRIRHEPHPIASDALPAYLREEAKKKETARRENLPDYTNRADSFRMLTIGEYSGCSWVADFTAPSGDKWAEYFVRIQTDVADASFFLQAPADQLEALRPVVDRLMAGVKMPRSPAPPSN